MTQLRVALLGSPRIEKDGRPVTFDTRKATALLAYLAVTDRPHSRDTLAALLWPDYEQVQARGALRRTLSVLRSATGETVLADRSTVGLQAAAGLHLDVSDFRALATVSDHCRPDEPGCPRCAARWDCAVAVYRDDFMAGFTLRDSPDFDDWQAVQSRVLRQELAGVLERLVRARTGSGDLAAAIDAAGRWLALDPLHEPAHATLMRLYAWTGQRSTAIRQYRECVGILHRELGVSPLSQTTALDQAVRSGRLARPRPADQRTAETAPTGTAAEAGVCVPPLPLVGRAGELAVIAAARAAVGTGGRLVVISGEAGIGKTRLLEALILTGDGAGGPVVITRCHEGEAGLAFGVIADLLRSALRLDAKTFVGLPLAWQVEVARLTPEVAATRSLPPPPALDSPGAQSRFRAALVAAISAALGHDRRTGEAATVLVVEDVHWADESSTDVLAYLLRRLDEVPVLVVLTWRPESVPRSGPLYVAVTAAVRDGLAEVVDLGRLDRAAVATLAAAVLPASTADETVRRLWQQSGGLPLFVTEYLESFRRGGRVPDGEQWQLPGGVRDLLQARLDALQETTRQVLAAGAVLGSDLAPDLLRSTSGRGEEEVVCALEEAVARAVILQTDRDGGTYDFGHDAMRQLIYDTTSLGRRRLLHGRAADALAQWRSPTAAAAIAAHLRRAGREAESAEWSWRAAERARSLYAHSEALEHLAAAAALGYPGPVVHQVTGDVLTALGRYRDALLAYEQAAAACSARDGLTLASIEHRLADVHHRLGAWELAASHLAAALELLTGEEHLALQARVLADVALVAHRRGQTEQAATAAERALDTASRTDDDAALAQAHNVLGVLAAERPDSRLAQRHLGDSLRHAAALTDPSHRVAALNNLALVHAESVRWPEAVAVAREALQLGLEHGDLHRAAALHTNLADLLHATGEQEEALDHLKAAARLFAAVDDDDELRRPEIWKLARW